MSDFLPFSKDTEKALLGGLMVDPQAIHQVRTILPKPDMLHPDHRPIYKAMLDLADENIPCDYIAVTNLLEKREQLQKVGGAASIGLFLTEGTSYYAEHYAMLIERDYIRREAMVLGARITKAAKDAENTDDLLAEINKGLMNLEKRRNGNDAVSMTDVADALCEQVLEWRNDPLPPGKVRGISTGMLEFDKLMGGMKRGESMVVICAVTGCGKTAFALTSAYRMARLGYKVMFFALEMKAETLAARLASAESNVSFEKIERGVQPNSDWYASPEDYTKFVDALASIRGTPNLYFDDTQDLTMAQIRAKAMNMAHKVGGLDLIVGDTGNLIQGTGDKSKNFAQTESDKVRGFRNLIKELDCIGYLTWQLLSKRVEARPAGDFGRMPSRGDLRDTGGAEEHASDVIGLYRDEMYHDTTKFKNIMHMIGLKRRNAKGKTRQLIGFDEDHQRFFSPATELEIKTQDLGYAF